MSGKRYEGGSYKPVYLPPWDYLGEQSITCDGTNQALTLPDDCNVVEIKAEGGLVRFSINGNPAQASSGGYIPRDTGEIIGGLSSLTGVNITGAAGGGVIAHMLYFRDHQREF